MSSKQLAANRRNALKSTGPRSVEGKARSSQNALKSGLYAESIVIGPERAEDLDALTADFYDEHQPATPTERSLVDQIVHTEWLLRRARRIEQEVTKWADANVSDRCREISAEGYIHNGKPQLALDRIHRQRIALARNQRQTLAELRRVRADRSSVPASDSHPAPQPLAPEPTYPQNGFVPSNSLVAPTPDPQPPAYDPTQPVDIDPPR